MVDSPFQRGDLIINDPKYLVSINIEVMMRDNVSESLYLLPWNGRICGKQLSMSHFIKILKTRSYGYQ